MKIGMMVIGIIGALIALIGSVVTMVGGVSGTAMGSLADNSSFAYGSAFVFWSGVVAILVSLFALVFSVTGGVAKRRNVILVFALGSLITGLLNIYLYNWFSGILIAVAGVLGMVGSKDGIREDGTLTKSPLFYVVLVLSLVLIAGSALVKNGNAIIASQPNAESVMVNPATMETIPAPSTKPSAASGSVYEIPAESSTPSTSPEIAERKDGEMIGTIYWGNEAGVAFYAIDTGDDKQHIIYAGFNPTIQSFLSGVQERNEKVRVTGTLVKWKDGTVGFDDSKSIYVHRAQ